MASRFNPPSGWPRTGRAFNHGVVQPEGNILHITGQVAWDQDGRLVGEGDVEVQMRKSFDNTIMILEAVGGRLDDIVSLTIYFLSRDHLPVIQRVRAEYFIPETAPTSTIFQTPGLVVPELLVELVPIAVIPPDRYRDPA